MNGVKSWFYGWKATLRLMIFDRETYRFLKSELSGEDFGEVPRPGGDDEPDS